MPECDLADDRATSDDEQPSQASVHHDPAVTANWDAKSGDRWTVPLGGGFGKLLKVGRQPITSRVAAYYNVDKPETGPDWSLSFTVQFLFRK